MVVEHVLAYDMSLVCDEILQDLTEYIATFFFFQHFRRFHETESSLPRKTFEEEPHTLQA